MNWKLNREKTNKTEYKEKGENTEKGKYEYEKMRGTEKEKKEDE